MERIEPHLPTDVRGVERAEDRRVISGIVHVLKSGCRWCDCPPEYGPPTAIYNRFVRCARRGIWENLFRELAGCGRSADTQMIDSTHVKAARSNSAPNQPSASRPGSHPATPMRAALNLAAQSAATLILLSQPPSKST